MDVFNPTVLATAQCDLVIAIINLVNTNDLIESRKANLGNQTEVEAPPNNDLCLDLQVNDYN